MRIERKWKRIQKKWMEVIREDMRGGCGIYYDTVRDSEEWKGKIQVGNPTCVG